MKCTAVQPQGQPRPCVSYFHPKSRVLVKPWGKGTSRGVFKGQGNWQVTTGNAEERVKMIGYFPHKLGTKGESSDVFTKHHLHLQIVGLTEH
ncbi:unnamed protein product, partial [Linum tenue]